MVTSVVLYQTLKGVCFFEGRSRGRSHRRTTTYQTLKGVCFFEGPTRRIGRLGGLQPYQTLKGVCFFEGPPP